MKGETCRRRNYTETNEADPPLISFSRWRRLPERWKCANNELRVLRSGDSVFAPERNGEETGVASD